MDEVISAEKFHESDQYRFPFVPLDNTPGGSNLGRIEWNIEIVRSENRDDEGRYLIVKLWVWANQTRDERYDGKRFEIQCFSINLMGHKPSSEGAFTDGLWRACFCEEHGNLVLTAYPRSNEPQALVINTNSSLGIDATFVSS